MGPTSVFLLGLLSFIPYPAIPVGSTSAVQMGNVITLLLLVPCLAMPWRRRPVFLSAVLLVPLLLSAAWVNVAHADALDLSVKAIIAWSVALLTMVAVQCLGPRYSMALLTGIAVATLLHVAIGTWQFFVFGDGEFPLLDLYVNQSFASVQENAMTLSRYMQRPFGIFPEPSAMSSSLAPWILLWLAEICGLVRFRHAPARWQRILFSTAAASGLALIIASRSGHTMITMAAVLFFGALWLRRARLTPRTRGTILAVFGVILPLSIWLTTTAMSDRVGAGSRMGNESWEARSDSMIVGFSLLAQGDLPTAVFGLGVGRIPVLVWNVSDYPTVWSLVLTYIYETGLIGVFACTVIAGFLLSVWKSSKYNPAFAAIVIVWLVGITLTTSYGQLLPIWVALGWLSVWPAVCAPAAAQTAEIESPAVAPRRREEFYHPAVTGQSRAWR